MKRRGVLLVFAGLLVVLLGFGAFTQVTALSYVALVNDLRAGGTNIVEGGGISANTPGAEPSKPLLSGMGRLLTVEGERVEI